MKALTIRQPWADAIAHGNKTTENRTWPAPTKYEGARILIHAAAAPDRDAVLPKDHGIDRTASLTTVAHRGAIIAVATLLGSHFDTAGCCFPWGMREVYHWRLADVLALPEPIPCKGQLGFWTPPEHALVKAGAQIAEAVR